MHLENMIKTEIWRFTIRYETQSLWVIGTVEITFTDKKFVSATYPMKGLYTENEWDLLAQINGKIKEIKKQYEEGYL